MPKLVWEFLVAHLLKTNANASFGVFGSKTPKLTLAFDF
jgi:hypothetical protein